MRLIKNLVTKHLKKGNKEQPWLDYYSEEDKNIKFTDKTIYDYLIECVGDDKDFIALNYFGTRMSYNEFFDKIDQAAKSFKTLGVQEGDIVTICVPNTPESVISFYSLNKIGAVADMIHPLSSSVEIKNYLEESKSKILVMVDIAYEKVKDIISETSVSKIVVVSPKDSMPMPLSLGYRFTRGLKVKKPKFGDSRYISWKMFMLLGVAYTKTINSNMKSKDLAVILHSGGTTGKPKGIMISNFNFNAECQQGGLVIPTVKPKDKIMTILPNFHGFGLCISIHAPLCFRVEVILIPEL